jgi:hypothetical protein
LFSSYGNAICEKTTERERETDRDRELQGLGGNDVTCYLIILKGRVKGERRGEVKAYIYIFNLSFLIIQD